MGVTKSKALSLLIGSNSNLFEVSLHFQACDDVLVTAVFAESFDEILAEPNRAGVINEGYCIAGSDPVGSMLMSLCETNQSDILDW